ncbi:uncharacterized protein WM277_015354 [Molossus nigricans]
MPLSLGLIVTKTTLYRQVIQSKLIEKKLRPHVEESVKECMMAVAVLLAPKQNCFRVLTMDITNTAQLAIFVSGIIAEFDTQEELLSWKPRMALQGRYLVFWQIYEEHRRSGRRMHRSERCPVRHFGATFYKDSLELEQLIALQRVCAAFLHPRSPLRDTAPPDEPYSGRRDPGPTAGSERFVPRGSGRGVLPESPSIGYTLGDWPGFPTLDWTGLPLGNTVPRLVSGRVSRGQSGFSPGGGRSETASVNARPSSLLLLRPGRAPPAGDAGHGVASPSAVRRAAKRPESSERHTKNAVSGGGERGRQFRDATPGRARSCRRRGWVRGRGDNAAGLRVPAPALPRLLQDGAPARPAPSGPGRPPPGKGRPLALAAGEGSRSAAAEPGNLRAGKSLRHLRGAARRGPCPWRPRSPPVTFRTRRQPGPRRGQRGPRGGPDSVRGLLRPGLRPWRVAVEEGQERKTTQEISSSGHREGSSGDVKIDPGMPVLVSRKSKTMGWIDRWPLRKLVDLS